MWTTAEAAPPLSPPEGEGKGAMIEIFVPDEAASAWSGCDLALMRVQLERLSAWGWTLTWIEDQARAGLRLTLSPPREAKEPPAGDDPGPCPF